MRSAPGVGVRPLGTVLTVLGLLTFTVATGCSPGRGSDDVTLRAVSPTASATSGAVSVAPTARTSPTTTNPTGSVISSATAGSIGSSGSGSATRSRRSAGGAASGGQAGRTPGLNRTATPRTPPSTPAGVASRPVRSTGTMGSGCSTGTTLCVGPGQVLRTLAQAVTRARDGAVIELLGGTYHETVVVTSSITIRSSPANPAVITCAGLRPAQDKACIVASGAQFALEDVVVTGARGSQGNEACLRNEPSTNVVLRGVECFDSNAGVLGSGGTWLIEDSLFHDNGAGDGQTHNVYLSGNCPTMVFRRSESRGAVGGHALKSRCRSSTVEDSVLNDNGVGDAADFPDGGTVALVRTTLHQPNGENGNIIQFGSESCSLPGSLRLINSMITNDRSRGYIVSKCGAVSTPGSTIPTSVEIKMS